MTDREPPGIDWAQQWFTWLDRARLSLRQAARTGAGMAGRSQEM
jgi:hypothetical protein